MYFSAKMAGYSYEAEQARLQKFMQEVVSDEEPEIDHSDSGESDFCEELEHHSESETDNADSDDEPLSSFSAVSKEKYYIGRDKKTKWLQAPGLPNVRTRTQNLVTRLPGAIGTARNAKEPIDCFLLFIDPKIIRSISVNTNIYITSIQHKYLRERDARQTDETEIKALIGLLLLAGSYRAGHQNLEDLWNQNGLGVEIFPAVMSLKRFLFLLQCLRFDDIRDRAQRRSIDRLAPFREIFEWFTSNCETRYSVSAYTTIDEQLVPFRGRCGFRQYIPSKPAKYGLKIQTICDGRTWYTLGMEVYVGRQHPGPYEVSNSPFEVVKRLVRPIEHTGRNITADNWYGSIPLAEYLLTKKLSFIGTLRKNKKELPVSFVDVKNREEKSSLFGFQNTTTIVSYVPKKKKNVILISTMHQDGVIDASTGDMKKPEIITLYNLTKAGVDTVDEMCGTYSTSRKCRRWPLVLFFRLLDIAGINSQVICFSNNPDLKCPRRTFLRQIGFKLVNENICRRATSKTLPKYLRPKIARISGIPENREIRPQLPVRKGRCVVCPRQKDIKTKCYCENCSRNMCMAHMKNICEECLQKIKNSDMESD